MTLLLSNRLGVLGSEFKTPTANGLIGNAAATLSQQILDISKTQREAVVEPHGTTDDFTRKAMSFVEHVVERPGAGSLFIFTAFQYPGTSHQDFAMRCEALKQEFPYIAAHTE